MVRQRPRRPDRRIALTLLVLLAATAVGCGSEGGISPSADVARASLEAALDAWKAGGKPGTLEGVAPPVEAVDSTWRSGRRLKGYEIVGEEPGEPGRRFRVRLSYEGPGQADDCEYVVLGLGPVWVYRDDDYRRMVEMDDNPAPTPRKKPRR